MQIRRYQPGEEKALWEIFYNTIRTVNIQDYTQQQVETWAPDEVDWDAWKKRIAAMQPFVCVSEDEVIGYAGLLESGYVDHFYVHHQWQRRGVGTRLMQHIEESAAGKRMQELTSDVSITAKSFFTSRGFEVVTPQEVERNGVVFKNFKMRKSF